MGLFASPVVGPDGTIYQTLMNDHRLYAVDPGCGTICWAVDLADPNQSWYRPPQDCTSTGCTPSPIDAEGWSEPVISTDGTLYVSLDDPYLRAVDPKGKILWGLDLGDPNLSSATGTGLDIVVDLGGFTLTVDQKGTLYAACDDGNLYVVSSQGSLKAQFKGPGQLSYPVVTRQGVILVTANLDDPDQNGLVLALTADTGAKP
jgi:outer membrane protein assembly factor BamB